MCIRITGAKTVLGKRIQKFQSAASTFCFETECELSSSVHGEVVKHLTEINKLLKPYAK